MDIQKCIDNLLEINYSCTSISRISEIFDVSMEAFANRYADLHHEPFAIVYSKDNKYRYFRASDSLPFYFDDTPRKNKPLPLTSLTKQVNKTKLIIFQSK